MKSRIRLLLAAACAMSLPVLPAAGHERDEQPAGSAILHIQEHEDHGGYLVDQQQTALYLFEADMQGGEAVEAQSNCYDDCATAWPPLVTESEPQVHDDLNAELLGTITREGGETQVTFNDHPLYYFSADAEPGHTRGHDIESHGAEWYLMSPDGEKAGEGH